MSHLVFVYGTLKRGFGNHGYLGDSTFVCEAKTLDEFLMSDGGFPVVYEKDDERFKSPFLAGHIQGEIYSVSDDILQHNLDRLEGHPEWYCREARKFLTEDGTVVSAWIYLGTNVHRPVETLMTPDEVSGHLNWS